MTASTIPIKLNASSLTRAFETLSMRLRANTSDPLEIVVCGGRWTMSHDVSEGFRSILENLLRNIDHGDAAEKL
jgi:hypothetical protein